ncbi:hypothetical protein [Cellvibrio sp.]|uniref:hypothetical protein n=1 Tax=Cellvibrio sp. TaxID=1965322 RepID=UPI0039647422
MTTQVMEKILYQGETLEMYTTPLEDYFAQMENRPQFMPPASCLWRGYVGKWEISNDQLFLLDFGSTLEDGTEVSMRTYFLESTDRVFAQWYSGQLHVVSGKLLGHIHIFRPIFERDIFIDVKQGLVVATKVVHNKKEDWSEKQWNPFG